MGGDLSKRTPGTPLSEAEHRQRQEAARARWAAAGAGAAAAVTGGILANASARRMQRQGWQEIRRAKAETIDAEAARHARVTGRLDLRRDAALARIRSGWPVPLYQRVLAHDEHVARRGLRTLPAEFINFDMDGQPIFAPIDQEQAGRLAADAERARVDLDALKDARRPRRVEQKAVESKVPKAHTRKIKTKVKADGPKVQRAQAHLDQVRQIHDGMLAASTDPYDPALMEAEREVVRAERRLERVKGGKGAVKTIEVGANRSAQDSERTAFRRATTKRVQGVPDDKGLARIRETLRNRVREQHLDRQLGEFNRHNELRAAARAAAEARWKAALRRMPSRGARLGMIGLGALAGGAAVGLGAYAIDRHRLGKVADRERENSRFAELRKFANQPEDPSDALLAAGDAAEGSIAERIARLFRDLRDAPAEDLLRPGADLVADLQRGLRHATAPIAEAMARGARTVPADAEVTVGEPMTLAFSFDARNPRVTNYIREYRDQKIRELANEQADTIRETIMAGAMAGTSPDEMARQVRQSIGLTAAQAAQVRAFRAQLETLDPRALGRALRDKRFDRTVRRAIDTQAPLSAEQVDKMVDAYHRRYLAYRATTIARTEGVGAANNGHVMAMREWLVQNPNYTVIKTWIATKDERTRPDHVALHGQAVVGLDETFTTKSGDKIRWPGDQDAPARQVVNCRCTISTRIVPRVRSLMADGGEGG